MYLSPQIYGQRVDAGHTHAVQTARNFVSVFIKLPPGVQHGHDHFQGRAFFFGVNARRDAPAVVPHRDGFVFFYNHVNGIAVARHRFVDGVVHYLPNQVV